MSLKNYSSQIYDEDCKTVDSSEFCLGPQAGDRRRNPVRRVSEVSGEVAFWSRTSSDAPHILHELSH